MKTQRIIVTGAAGFMGSWLVDELIDHGHEVIGIDDLSGGYLRNVNKDSTFIKGDLRNEALVKKVTKNVDIIYHLAAYAAEGQSVFSPMQINDRMLRPMNNLLVAAVNNDVDKFVFTSTMAVYGKQVPPFDERMPRAPEDPYGIAKAYCENMLECFNSAHKLRYTIIRPHNVYGERQNIADPYRNVLGIWINRIMRKKAPYIYGDGEQVRAFSYIKDTTKALAKAGFTSKADGEIINIGSPEGISINNACKSILDLMDHSDMKPIYMPARPQEVKYAYTTTKKSERILEYENTHDFRKGVSKMIRWAMEMGAQKPTYTLPLEIRKPYTPKVWMKRMI